MNSKLIERPILAVRKPLAGRERGETLIESMVALAIVMFSAVSMLAMNVASSQGLAVSSKLTNATVLAANKLEDLLRLPSTHASLQAGTYQDGNNNLNSAGTPYFPDGSASAGSLMAAWGTADGWYYRSWLVQDQVLAGSSVNNFKLVTVTVAWFDVNQKVVKQVQTAGGMLVQ